MDAGSQEQRGKARMNDVRTTHSIFVLFEAVSGAGRTMSLLGETGHHFPQNGCPVSFFYGYFSNCLRISLKLAASG